MRSLSSCSRLPICSAADTACGSTYRAVISHILTSTRTLANRKASGSSPAPPATVSSWRQPAPRISCCRSSRGVRRTVWSANKARSRWGPKVVRGFGCCSAPSAVIADHAFQRSGATNRGLRSSSACTEHDLPRPSRSEDRSGPEIAGNLANVDWVTAMIGPAGWTSPGCHYWWVVHPAVRTFGTMRQ
jgi:hypothetical protein